MSRFEVRRGGQAPNPRRAPAHRRQHRQAGGVVDCPRNLIQPAQLSWVSGQETTPPSPHPSFLSEKPRWPPSRGAFSCRRSATRRLMARRPSVEPLTPDRHLPRRTEAARHDRLRIPKKLSGISALADQPRRFPPPWSVEETDGGLLVTGVDPAAVSRAPYPAGSVASTAATAATAASYQTSYQQAHAHAATAATATSATTSCTAAAPAAAYMAAAAATRHAASAASAASPCKPYAGAKFSFFVENVKGPQAHIKHFLLGEKNSLPRILGRNVCYRRVCRCAARHRQRNPGSRPHG